LADNLAGEVEAGEEMMVEAEVGVEAEVANIMTLLNHRHSHRLGL
jgi:hypothetical protein